MHATVTLRLDVYDKERADIRHQYEKIERIEKALMLVHNTGIDALLRLAREIEDSKAASELRLLVSMGKL